MNDELTEFLEERQRQIFSKMTDMYGRFKSAKAEAFWEGYIECMQDVSNFFEDKERNNQE